MLKVDQKWLDEAEAQHPGIRQTIEFFEQKELPPCALCGSIDTAMVSAGIVGRSICVAAATTKIRLLGNGHPGDFACNKCGGYFNEPK